MTAMTDSITWSDRNKQSHPWDAVTISSLKTIDRNDELWEMGTTVIQAGLESVNLLTHTYNSGTRAYST